MTMSTFVLLLSLISAALSMRDQSIAVSGKLMCGEKSAANVRVKLWEEDEDSDDLLDQGYTNKDGFFRLQGGTAELMPIDPVLKIYHDCNDFLLLGSRKVKIGIPKSYITNGKVAKSTYDVGTINLESIFYEEAREMIVSRRRRTSRLQRSGTEHVAEESVVKEMAGGSKGMNGEKKEMDHEHKE